MLKFSFGRQGVGALALVGSLLPGTAAWAQSKPAHPPPSQTPAPGKPAATPIGNLMVERQVWTGDFDAMIKRRIIRVLVPHSRTSYFVERGQPRGIVSEAF